MFHREKLTRAYLYISFKGERRKIAQNDDDDDSDVVHVVSENLVWRTSQRKWKKKIQSNISCQSTCLAENSFRYRTQSNENSMIIEIRWEKKT